MEFILFNVYFLMMALLYRILFDKRGDIKLNRWLLLATPVFLFVILIINRSITAQSGLFIVELDLLDISTTGQTISEASGSFSTTDWLMLFYSMGVIVVGLMHCFNFIKLYRLIRNATFLYNYKKAKVYETNFNASFGNVIFINQNLSEEERRIILIHEYAHVVQKHSADRIYADIVQTICWFNPGVYLWKADIEKNHEYLADQEVLSNTSREDYTLFLLEQQLNLKSNQLRLPLSNMSNLKSRVMRMNRKTSSVLSYLIVPVIAMGMMSSKFLPATGTVQPEEKSEQQVQKSKDPVEDPDVHAEFKGGVQALKTFIAAEVKYPKKSVENNVEGKVFVEAVISEEGKVTKVKVLRGVDEHIDAEAARVVTAMPDWKPAQKDGKPVASIVRMPINFVLNNKNEDKNPVDK